MTQAQNDSEAAVWLSPDDLTPWAKNPRNNEHAVQAVADSISRFGFAAPIVARTEDRRVIAGHTRLLAAQRLGMAEVPVRLLDVSEAEADALALADNKLGELADWDDEALADVLAELDDFTGVGWSDDELNTLLSDAEDALLPIDIDEPGEPPTEPQSRRGEIYELGPHRLVCGDSGDPGSWAAATHGDRVSLVLTDPPYGLGDTASVKNNYQQYEDTQANLIKLAARWLPLAIHAAPTVVFTPGNGNMRVYPAPSWTMAWFTPAGVGRGPWGFCCWQPILCYGPDPSLASGNGCRPDALVHSESSPDLEHPCPKPLGLWLWLIDRLIFERGAVIVDPFGGSGTTLIGAAESGAIARLIEIDPIYCDVIRQRWTRYARKRNIDPGPGALE